MDMSVSLHHASSIDTKLRMHALLEQLAEPLLAEQISPEPARPLTSVTVTAIDTSERKHHGMAAFVRKDVGDCNGGMTTIVSLSSLYVDGNWFHWPLDEGKRDEQFEDLLRHEQPLQIIAVELRSSNPDDVEYELRIMRALMTKLQIEISDKWPRKSEVFAQSFPGNRGK